MLPAALNDVIEALGRLPGVGPRTAERYAYFLLKSDQSVSQNIAAALTVLHKNVKTCPKTFAIMDASEKLSPLYDDPTRDKSTVLVVEEPLDIYAIEHTKSFTGTYHVLGGAISPMDGITADKLHISELIKRVADDDVGRVDEGRHDLGVGAEDELGAVLEEVRDADRRDEDREPGGVAQGRVGHLVDQHAEQRAAADGEDDGKRRVKPQARHRDPGDVRADHDDVAVREVEQQDDAVDHRVAQSDERVDAAQLQTVEHLRQKRQGKHFPSGSKADNAARPRRPGGAGVAPARTRG